MHALHMTRTNVILLLVVGAQGYKYVRRPNLVIMSVSLNVFIYLFFLNINF